MSLDVIITYRYRVKDETSAKRLRRLSGTANQAWNHLRCHSARGATPTGTIAKPIGSGRADGRRKQLGIHSDTPTARQFVDVRKAAKHRRRWCSRKRGQLGWVPFNAGRAFRFDQAGGSVVVLGRKWLRVCRRLPADAKIKMASFAEDARGRCYFNIEVEIAESAPKEGATVAIDLGRKDLATLSGPRTVEMPAFYHNHEVTADEVTTAALAPRRMAKSVLDAGWSRFRDELGDKALRHGAAFEGVSENVSEKWSIGCACGRRGGAKGIAPLRMRRRACSECKTLHDGDVNAVRDVLCRAERPPGGRNPPL